MLKCFRQTRIHDALGNVEGQKETCYHTYSGGVFGVGIVLVSLMANHIDSSYLSKSRAFTSLIH